MAWGVLADASLLSDQGQSHVTGRSAAHPSTHKENVHLVSKATACLRAASQDNYVKPTFGGPCDLETMVEALSWPPHTGAEYYLCKILLSSQPCLV